MPVTRVVLDKLRSQLFRLRDAPGLSRLTALGEVAAVAMVAVALTTSTPAGLDPGAGGLSLSPAGDSLMATMTKLTVSPGSAQGSVATLAATEAAMNGAHPAGWIQFQAGSTDIGAPIRVSSAGLATTRAAILGVAPAATALSATFTPATSAYLASVTTAAVGAQSSGTAVASIAVTLSVPFSGNFTVTVPADTLALQGSVNSGVATGSLQTITVSEGRNWAPGWSVSGQESDFTSKGRPADRTIPGTELGWVPSGVVTDGVTLGPTVRPGSPGLGSAGALLAVAKGSGFGTQTLGAELILIIPGSDTAAPYSGLLTITYLEAASLPASSGQTSLPQAG